MRKIFLGGALLGTGYLGKSAHSGAFDWLKGNKSVDYGKVREDIAQILNKEGYDDGSIGPVLVRLAWHASGTWDAKSKTGGSNGSTMRFKPELGHGANAGLDKA